MGYDKHEAEVQQRVGEVDIPDLDVYERRARETAANKVITLEGKGDCPADRPQGRAHENRCSACLSPDKLQPFEMFDGSKGENVRTMEITYTRK